MPAFRKQIRVIVAVALSLVSGIQASAQAGGPRFALVIGNSNYATAGKLKNPVNDASDIAAVLKKLGFSVELLTDADLPAMEASVDRFGESLSGKNDAVGFFFFAGHGVQSAGANYLIPVDARIPSEAYLKTSALPVQAVLEILQASRNKTNIMVLDACRDNPFSWARSMTRGLTVVGSQPPGSIIAYATGVGNVARDGEGRNGVFTSELLKNLGSPGADILEVFQRTGAGVQAATEGAQTPAIYSQFYGKLYLAGVPQGQAPQSAKGMAGLSLFCDPPGMKVSIDGGQPVSAPFNAQLSPGSHSLEVLETVVNDRYFASQPKQWLSLAAGDSLSLPVKAQPEFATLSIKLAPPGCSVFVNDQELGLTPIGQLRVQAGNLLVRFERDHNQVGAVSIFAKPESKETVFWGMNQSMPIAVANRSIQLDGKTDSWAGLDPLYDDPDGLSLMGKPEYSVNRVYLCQDGKNLYWRLDFSETNPFWKMPSAPPGQFLANINFDGDGSSLYLGLTTMRDDHLNWVTFATLQSRDRTTGKKTDLANTTRPGSPLRYKNTKGMLVGSIPLSMLKTASIGSVDFRADLAYLDGGDWKHSWSPYQYITLPR